MTVKWGTRYVSRWVIMADHSVGTLCIMQQLMMVNIGRTQVYAGLIPTSIGHSEEMIYHSEELIQASLSPPSDVK